MDNEELNDDKSNIYSRKKTLKENNFEPSFLKRGATTTITMGSEKFTVVDPVIINNMIEHIKSLQTSNVNLKEQIRLQNIRLSELTQKSNEQSMRINKIINEINRNSWKDNGLS